MIELPHGLSLRPLMVEILDVTIQGLEQGARRPVTLEVRFSVLCRDTGTPLELAFGQQLDRQQIEMSPDYLPRIVRGVLQKCMCHEVDEALMLGGKLLNDPHPNARS